MMWRFTKRSDGAVIMLGTPPVREKFSHELVMGGGRVSYSGGILEIKPDNAVIRYMIFERLGDSYHGKLIYWRDRQEVTTLADVEPVFIDGVVRYSRAVYVDGEVRYSHNARDERARQDLVQGLLKVEKEAI